MLDCRFCLLFRLVFSVIEYDFIGGEKYMKIIKEDGSRSLSEEFVLNILMDIDKKLCERYTEQMENAFADKTFCLHFQSLHIELLKLVNLFEDDAELGRIALSMEDSLRKAANDELEDFDSSEDSNSIDYIA